MPVQCCINSCQSERPDKNGRKEISLFKLPRDSLQRKEWLEAISPHLKSKKVIKHYHVCQKHFDKEDLILDNPIVLKSGEVAYVQRYRATCKRGRVPSIFHTTTRNSSTAPSPSESVPIVQSDMIVASKSPKCQSAKLLLLANANNMMPPLAPITSSVDQEKRSSNSGDSENFLFPSTHSSTASINTSMPPISSSFIKNSTPIVLPPVPEQQPYTLQLLRNDLMIRSLEIPDKWGFSDITSGIFFFYYGDTESYVTRSILIKPDMTTEIRAMINVVNCDKLEYVRSFDNILAYTKRNTELKLCKGVDDCTACLAGFYKRNSISKSERCLMCQAKRKWITDQQSKQKRRLISKVKKLQHFKKNTGRRYFRLQSNMTRATKELNLLRYRCSLKSDEAVEEAISILPVSQQEATRACFNAAKCKGPTGMRYTHSWILECLLLRIKSRRGYLHIRNKKILPVPTIGTLNKYIKNLKSSYGFCPETSKLLKQKSQGMHPNERGTLVVDEMQVSQTVSFDSNTLGFNGFTYLGNHTPENQKNKRGDHALVFLFQPFRGKWIQTVAAFLSLGCARSKVLTKLITECIILLENAGLFVDVVTTDGASWNRSMWRNFGLSDNDCKCEHPCSLQDNDSNSYQPKRFLRFCSDFSHLIKIIRNLITSGNQVITPDGIIKLIHFQEVLKCDGMKHLGLKIAPKLTPDDLNPKYYQKMNVGMALRIFSGQVASAMEIYRDDNGGKNENLRDCEPTIRFINRFRKVIIAMSSRSSLDALAYGNDNYKTIVDFSHYLETWHDQALENGWKFMSANTYEGLRVSLKTAIETMTFLTEECNYEWFMTARLNQDALEGFFGMIRSACGSNDHPDSLLFIQVYRLMSFHSLVKSPKGSNVESLEIFENLISPNDQLKPNPNGDQWNDVLDKIVERGNNNPREYDVYDSHDYIVKDMNQYAQAYVAGFTGFRISKKFTSCSKCLSSMFRKEGTYEKDSMINILSEGKLKYPSDKLFELTCAVEKALMKTVGQEELQCYSFLHMAENIRKENLTFVGCKDHEVQLTKKIINCYAITRSRMLVKSYNKCHDEANKESREYRKRAKLVSEKKKQAAQDSKNMDNIHAKPIQNSIKKIIEK